MKKRVFFMPCLLVLAATLAWLLLLFFVE